MKTRFLSIAILLTLGLQLFGQFGPKLDAELVRQRKTRLSKVEMYDDKTEQISFLVRIKCLGDPVQGLYAKVWVFGESILDRKRLKIFSVDEHPLDLGRGQTTEFATTVHNTTYDNTGVIKYGERYSGWVLLVRDVSGKIAFQKASTPSYLKDPTALDGLLPDRFCDKNFRPQ